MKPLLLFSTAAMLLVIPVSADEPRTFTAKETQTVAINSYVCGRIDAATPLFLKLGRDIKPLQDMYLQAGCAEIHEMLELK